MSKDTLNQPPSLEEKIYFRIMTKASELFTTEINQSAIDPEKKQLAIIKSSLFTIATLMFQQAKAEKMDENQINVLIIDCCHLLTQAVKGICTGAQSLEDS